MPHATAHNITQGANHTENDIIMFSMSEIYSYGKCPSDSPYDRENQHK